MRDVDVAYDYASLWNINEEGLKSGPPDFSPFCFYGVVFACKQQTLSIGIYMRWRNKGTLVTFDGCTREVAMEAYAKTLRSESQKALANLQAFLAEDWPVAAVNGAMRRQSGGLADALAAADALEVVTAHLTIRRAARPGR